VNYPPSFTQSEHDRYFAVGRDIQHAHEEECHLCHRVIVFDSARRLWFLEEDYEIYGFRWLAADSARDAFNTQKGWVCSTACWNDHAVDANELGGAA
jgi:hypothetical protein